MKHLLSKDSLVGIILLVLIGICFQAVHMPMMFSMVVHTLIVLLFIVFAVFVWREKARDERELAHQMSSGRTAFLIGVGILVLAVFFEGTVQQEVNPWLLIALVAMVLAKIVSRMFSDLRQ